ncbi:MAG: hypothetical protein EOM20_05560 [Spartobacteria bacterium]|nr:hypothetical protein [Spartobacteria bacterium]
MRRKLCFFVFFLVFLAKIGVFASVPGFGEPLDLVTGVVYAVSNVTELKGAFSSVNAAGVPATILIADGTYMLDTWALPLTCDNVIIRGASGNREQVVIRGPDTGYSASVEHIFWVQANTVTVADITFGWCRYHGIQAHGQSPIDASGLWVHNCHLINCNEQFIKGTSASGDPEGITDGIIENCLFEFTDGYAYQYYTGGIDIHKGVNWLIRDNLFRNIRTPPGGGSQAEHAIHFWNRCTSRAQNVTVERNVVINCDRGIGFGLSSYAGGFDGGDSVIRNNFVYNDGEGPFTDVGIGLEYANDVRVDNNTVYVPYWAPIEYRFNGSSNLVFRNNLVNGNITARDTAPAAILANNIQGVQASWFRNLTNGDLRLMPGASGPINTGMAIADFAEDIDGATRPVDLLWDVGADEYDPYHTDSDGDLMTDCWEVRYGLDPADAADGALDGDADRICNWQEWVADTEPTNGASFFHVSEVSNGTAHTISFLSSTARVYSLERCGTLTGSQEWHAVSNQVDLTGNGARLSLNDTNPASMSAYRVRVAAPFRQR